MSNQVFSWSLFVVPWLSLVLMRREEIRRYLPAGLLGIVLTTIIHDIGITYGFWEVRDPARPMYEMLPYFYGLIPVLSIWILKYTEGRFWFYFTANVMLDFLFAYHFLAVFLPGMGIYGLVRISSFQVWLINLVHMLSIYAFQKWLEGELVPAAKAIIPKYLRPAEAKPFPRKNRR